jgi:hypothetical protein
MRARELARAVEEMTDIGRAAVFGICGSALMPLLADVERRTAGRWTFAGVGRALDIPRRYATGLTEKGDHSAVRGQLLDAAPHGHDLDSPWSTYAQNAVICVDAAVVASSVNASEFRPTWIQYVLEPLNTWEENGNAGGNASQVPAAAGFLQRLITGIGTAGPISEPEYDALIREAEVICPAIA